MKPSEHTPASASLFAELALEAGVPAGVLNVVHGIGGEAGAPLVAHTGVDLVSFTGSAATGRAINEVAARRLAKTCLELGGKNALVVCDDADLDERRSTGPSLRHSRTPASAARRRAGSSSSTRSTTPSASGWSPRCDVARPTARHQPASRSSGCSRASARLAAAGATVLTGGTPARAAGLVPRSDRRRGAAAPDASISRTELFGPVTILYRVDRPRRGDRARERLPVRPHCRRSTRRASTARCGSPNGCRPASSS